MQSCYDADHLYLGCEVLKATLALYVLSYTTKTCTLFNLALIRYIVQQHSERVNL